MARHGWVESGKQTCKINLNLIYYVTIPMYSNVNKIMAMALPTTGAYCDSNFDSI